MVIRNGDRRVNVASVQASIALVFYRELDRLVEHDIVMAETVAK